MTRSTETSKFARLSRSTVQRRIGHCGCADADAVELLCRLSSHDYDYTGLYLLYHNTITVCVKRQTARAVRLDQIRVFIAVTMSNMGSMDEFLQESKEALSLLGSFDTVRVIMGNGTCDLDSAVCALVQGYLEYLDMKKTDKSNIVAIIPLMNIPRREYCIKTEVVYSFKCHTISPDLLTFRDEIDLKELKDSLAGTTLEVVLVDHHALPEEDSFLTDSVIRVIDHRPRDANWPWHHRDVCIEPVGSCTSLVARRFLDTHPEFADCRIGKLLRGPILIDTCNLSEKTERTTPVDVQTLERLEHLIKQFDSEDCQLEDRNTVYSRLIQARNDIGELSLDDLLIKDVKVIDGVPIVGMPTLIRKFIAAKPSPIPYDAICNFAVARNTRVVILLGMLVEPNEIRRDFALFSLAPATGSEGFHLADDASLRANEIFKQMYDLFMADPCLRLRNESTFEDHNGKWEMVVAEQTNLAATRKQLVKIFPDIIEKIHDFKINNQSRPKWVEERLGCSSSS